MHGVLCSTILSKLKIPYFVLFFCFLLILRLVQVETPRAVFSVPLISLRKSGQMRQGLPLVLTHIVEFVEKHGECLTVFLSVCHLYVEVVCICKMCVCV